MYQHLRHELEVIASEELADVLESWPAWNTDQRARLARYLAAELAPYGMLSTEKGRECGSPMAAIRRDARRVLELVHQEPEPDCPYCAPDELCAFHVTREGR